MARDPETEKDVATTGHEWDGIVELDNPLPRWWLWVFYACIVFAVGYWIAMPAWPGLNGYTKGILGYSDRTELARQLTALEELRGDQMARLRQASLAEIEADPALQEYALMVGQSVFGDNCATCHGIGGTGSKGYANLRDDVWLWGGSLADIHQTIAVGVRSTGADTRMSQMPAYGRDGLLTPEQISDLTEYVVALSRRQAEPTAVTRAAPLFQQYCAACHTPQGTGDQTKGAPNLTDQEWLFGSDRTSIRAQIVSGRGGVMPAWGARLKPETVKALAVYVHVNAAEK
jgi:cytochrome c oxidase cbb3-type subunit 3